MPQRMYMERLVRLTLVRKSRATAKHPANRDGVVEVVKSTASDLDPVEYDWYEAFDDFIESWEGEPPEDWCAAFDTLYKEAASKKRKNYPDGAGPFAGPHNSFPISSQHHVYAAARLLGHAENSAQVKANIIRIAHEKGYALPKSWTKKTKVTKSMPISAEKATKLVQMIMDSFADEATPPPATSTPALSEPDAAEQPATEVAVKAEEAEEAEAEAAEADPTTPPEEAEAPEEVPAAEVEPEAEDKEAARPAKGHSHTHAHLSAYGYSYSHNHQHGDGDHTGMPANEHDESEVAHAHEHVEKADGFGVDDIPMLVADRAGLHTALTAAQAELAQLQDKVAALEAAQVTAVEKAAISEKRAQDLYANLLRRPLTLPPNKEASDAPAREIKSDTPWDEAFDIAMGRK